MDKKTLQKALQAALEARAARHVADPAKRAENLAKWQAQTPKEVTEPIWYHGTRYDYDVMQPGEYPRASFVTTNPNFANNFALPSRRSADLLQSQIDEARRLGRPIPQPNVMPVHVRAENPFDYENPDHVAAVINAVRERAVKDPSLNPGHAETIARWLHQGDWNLIEGRPVQQALKELGHDAFYVNENGIKNLGVFDPERQLKSATGNLGTFDPKSPRLDENRGGTVDKALWVTRPKFAAGGLTEEEKALIRRQLMDSTGETRVGLDPNNPASAALALAQSQAQNQPQDQPQSQPTQTGGNFFSDKLADIAANPGRTAVNAAFGLVPVVGPLNTISGFFNGPTVGGALLGNKGTQAPASPWDRVAPIDLNTAPAAKSPGPQAAVNPADLPAPTAQEAGGKSNQIGLPVDISKAIIAQAAQGKGVPADWAHAVVASETGGTFDPNLSAKGSSAKGYYQITNPTWQTMGGKGSPFNPQENARVGAALMQGNIALLQSKGIPVTPQNLYMVNFLGRTGALPVLQNPDKPISETLSNYKSAAAVNKDIVGKTGQQVADLYGSKLAKNTPNFNPNQTLEDWQAQQSQKSQPAAPQDTSTTRDQTDDRGPDQSTQTSQTDQAANQDQQSSASQSTQSTVNQGDNKSADNVQFSISEVFSGGVDPQSGVTPGGFGFGAFGTPAAPAPPEAPTPPGDLPSPDATPQSGKGDLVPGDLKAAADKYFADKDKAQQEEEQAQQEQAQQQEQAAQEDTEGRPGSSPEPDDDDDDDDDDDGDDGSAPAGDDAGGGDASEGDGGADDGDGDGDGDGGGGDGGGGEKRGGRIIRKNKRQRPKTFNVRHAATGQDTAAVRRALAVALKASKRGK